MSDRLAEAKRRALQSLIPPAKVPLDEWLEANLRLPDGVSALPGPIRLYPFQREIAEAIGDPSIERVTLVKPVRVGFTTLLTGALAHYASNDPAPILALLPTESDCRDYIVSDVEPIFDASPGLKGLIMGEQDELGRTTLLHRRFPGGSLKVVAAKAPRNLRRHNVRVLFVDEADAMPPTPEGSPLVLAERRTLSFPDRKIVVGSTPLEAETSAVLRAYAQSDQRVFEVPCPACGAFTEILWSHIEWQPDRPETAAFRCPHCEALVQERSKTEMVAAGRWRATAPEVTGHAGFRLNALVSPLANASWGRLAVEFIRAKSDTDELRAFVNTILGQGWQDQAEEVDELELAGRVEPIGLTAIPETVRSLTAGADVQDDRIEVSIVGWSADEAMVLAHLIVWGAPDDDTTWAELDELLRSRWRHPYGGELGIDGAVVDSGNWTDRVYSFCFPRLRRRIWAGKGVAGSRPALAMSQGKVKGGRLFLVGVDTLKTTILSRLSRGRSIRFSDSLEASYFEQLASERKVIRYTRGQPVKRFERKPGARAETLDCLVYAFAAHAGAPVPPGRENELRSTRPVVKAAPRVVKSKWLQGVG